MSNEITKVEPSPMDILTARERSAYSLSITRKEPFLSPILADQFYKLFESGRSCEEIQGLNKGISLGIVVRARIDFGWDDKRIAHFESLREHARTQAQNLTLESVAFLEDLLTSFHKSDREKLQRFIQTGNPDELKGALITTPSSLKVYQGVVELLMKLTGQDSIKTQTVQGVIEHHHTVEAAQADRPLTPAEAASVLSSLVSKK